MTDGGLADESILQTKILHPPVRNVVRRGRLVEKLDKGSTRKLTLVSAPAGYGKTTLVASWLAERSRDGCWLNLGELDGSAQRLTTYLTAALARLEPRRADPDSDHWVAFINTLAGRQRETEIVLDDYHLAESAEINDLVMMLLGNLPPAAHLVLITRTDPMLRLAKLRGQGELVEIRQSDLAFTLEESRTFFAEICGIALPDAQVKTLSRGTEGWIAGLQMLAPTLKDTSDPSVLIGEIRSRQRYLRDYLVEEVISRLDRPTREFLERCSILERLSADLCDAVTGRTDSREVLSGIDRQNLFMSPLDEERRWFRLHHVFADLLATRLQDDHPQELPLLHKKASEWFDAHHFPGEAISHRVASGDARAVAELINRHAHWLMKQGELMAVRRWIGTLPDEVRQGYAAIQLLHAWAGLMDGRPLADIERELDSISGTGVFTAHALCLRSHLAGLHGDDVRALRLSEEALRMIDEKDLFVSGEAKFRVAVARLASGAVGEAIELLNAAASESLEAGNLPVAAEALAHEAWAFVDRGDLDNGEQAYQRALDLSIRPDGSRGWYVGMALIGLGEISRLRGNIEGALALFREGMETSQDWLDLATFSRGLGFSLALLAHGQQPDALQALQSAEQVAQTATVPRYFARLVAAYRTLVLLHCGRLQEARACLPGSSQSQGRNADGSLVEAMVSDVEILVRARLSLLEGDSRACVGLALTVGDRTRKQGRGLHALYADLLLVQAYWQTDQTDEALAVLARALSFAAGSGIVQPFVDEGPRLARILYRARTAGVDHPFVGKLLAVFPLEQQSEAAAETQPQSVEPLTTREVTVLTLLSQGLSNKEIAAQLYLSVRTVKWYTSSIYAKLGVSSRTQAIAKARQLEILP